MQHFGAEVITAEWLADSHPAKKGRPMENKCVLYIAASLDGYIADANGGIGFLDEAPSPEDLGYDEFYSTVGTIIMGGKTYRQIAYGLFPGAWPYAGKPCYVYTHGGPAPAGVPEGVTFTALPPAELLGHIRRAHGGGGNIWLEGGGEVIRMFLQEDLIDEYRIYLIPTLLGGGLPLFPPVFPTTNLTLQNAKPLGQITELIYRRKGQSDGN